MAKIKCPECGNMIDEKVIECPVCGTKIAENIVRCEHCGEVYFKDDGLCPNCHRPPKNTEKNRTKQQTVQEEPKKETESTNTQKQDQPAPVVVAAKDEADTPKTPSQEEDQHDETPKDVSSDVTPTQVKVNTSPTDPSLQEDEDIEKPVVKPPFKLKLVPMLVSFAIAAIIGLVSIYFYRDSKNAKEKQAYQLAIESSDTLELQHFLSQYSDADKERKDSVSMRLQHLLEENRSWLKLQAEKTKENVSKYILTFPDGAHFNEAQTVMDSIDWAVATSENTALAYHAYLKEHAEGIHALDAKTRIYGSHMDVVEPEEKALVLQSLNTFFTAINKHDKEQFKKSLHSRIVSFMGTESPTVNEVVAWLDRQYADGVQSINWTLNEQSDISKKKSDIAAYEYRAELGATKNLVKNGSTTQDRYKITARMTPDGKISSFAMVKHVAQEGDATKPSSSSADKPKPSSSSTSSNNGSSGSKPSSSSKPSTSSSSKPSTSSSSKPSTSSKPSMSSNKPSGSNTKPANQTSKPNTSGSKPSSSSKPSTSSSTKNNTSTTKTNTKPTTSTNKTNTKPATSTGKTSSTSKPSTTSNNKTNTSQKSNTTTSNKQNTTSSSAKKSNTSSSSNKTSTPNKSTNASSAKKSNTSTTSSNKSSSSKTNTSTSKTNTSSKK